MLDKALLIAHKNVLFSHPSDFRVQDQMSAGVNGHMSLDICCFIESYRLSDRVHLKKLTGGLDRMKEA